MPTLDSVELAAEVVAGPCLKQPSARNDLGIAATDASGHQCRSAGQVSRYFMGPLHAGTDPKIFVGRSCTPANGIQAGATPTARRLGR